MPARGILLYRSTSDRRGVVFVQASLTALAALCFGPFLALPLVGFHFLLRLFPEWGRRAVRAEARVYRWPGTAVLALFWLMSAVMLVSLAVSRQFQEWVFWAWMGVFAVQIPLVLLEAGTLFGKSRALQ